MSAWFVKHHVSIERKVWAFRVMSQCDSPSFLVRFFFFFYYTTPRAHLCTIDNAQNLTRGVSNFLTSRETAIQHNKFCSCVEKSWNAVLKPSRYPTWDGAVSFSRFGSITEGLCAFSKTLRSSPKYPVQFGNHPSVSMPTTEVFSISFRF
jgi:hypothetical protein